MRADPTTTRAFRVKLVIARLALSFERAWPALFPATMVLALFVIVSLFDLWAALPIWLHLPALAGFALAFFALLWRARGAFALAGVDAGLARLERDTGETHQPLRSLVDRLPEAVRDPVSARLWRRHRERVIASLGRLAWPTPRSALPGQDPWALRGLVLLLLVVALVEARGDFGPRLARAFVPEAPRETATRPLEASLWLTPPTYTRRAPVGAEQTARLDTLAVPEGSEALLQLHGVPDEPTRAPTVTFAGEPLELAALGEDGAELRMALEEGGALLVQGADGGAVAQWQITVEEDAPPEIAFDGEPEQSLRGALEVGYVAGDDYGLKEIALVFAPADRPEASERSVLVQPSRAPAELENSSYLDLSAHPQAGLPVTMHLEAIDGRDQVGRSETIEVVLPERQFQHPLARAVIEQRKRLVRHPHRAEDVAQGLDRLAATDAAARFGPAVPLSLGTASSRLMHDDGGASQRSVVDMLWEIALFIEDGALSLAERSLRELQEELKRALMEGAEESEIQALMDELREAMDRFLDEMARQAMERQPPQQPMDRERMQPADPSQMVDRQQLQEMLDRAQELMESGAVDEAMEMLAQLQEMLENMQTAMQQPMEPHPGEQALNDLQRMIELQQDLQDRSFEMNRQLEEMLEEMRRQQGREGQEGQQRRQGQQGEQGQQGMERQAGQAAGEQEGLRRALGELMRRLGEAGMEIPRALGQAEMQMRDARSALEEGDPGQAVEPQGSAADLMQQGGQAMMEQLRQMLANQPGMRGQPGRAERQGRDPLGRSTRNQGGFETEGTEVPDESDLGRARDVLEELYRRSRDRNRPPHELDYYDRLLDRF